MIDKTVRYKLFGLLRTITETTKEKKVRKFDILYIDTSVTKRYIFGDKISWVIRTSTWSYTEKKEKK